jgi:predicted ester cyclase
MKLIYMMQANVISAMIADTPGARNMTLTRTQMDAAVDEHFRYETRDDIEGVLATLTEDVDHDIVGWPAGPSKGRAEARGFYQQLFTDLDEGRVTCLHRYYGQDFVVDESLWSGIAVGNPLGLPGRNRPLEFRLLHVFEFTGDGAIRRENVWMDTAAIAQQLDDLATPARDLVRRFYEEFDCGALARFDSIADDFEATVFGSTKLDWPGFVSFGRSFLEAFADGRHVFDRVVVEGDTVATIGRYEGTHTGDLMGVAATGRRVSMAVMHLDRVEHGRIVEHRGIGDINGMWQQLGVAPPHTS